MPRNDGADRVRSTGPVGTVAPGGPMSSLRAMTAMMKTTRPAGATAARVLAPCLLVTALVAAYCSFGPAPSAGAASAGGRVLLVGTFKGHAGTYKTIQGA